MALSPSRQEHKKSLAIAMTRPQLLTPEEPLADNFLSKASFRAFQAAVPSPPESPKFISFSTQSQFQQNDDVLYPEHNASDSLDTQQPLFNDSNRSRTPARQHTPSADAQASVASPYSRHDSALLKDDDTLHQRLPESHKVRSASPVGPISLNNHYGLDWYRFCCMQNEEQLARKRAQRTLPIPTQGAARDSYTRRVISSLDRPSRVEKTIAIGPGSTRSKAMKVLGGTKAAASNVAPMIAVKHESHAKRIRRQTSTPDASAFGTLSNVGQPKPRTRAAPSKRVDDKGASDWRQIPDYCPPLDSLDKMSEKLNVVWTNSNELSLGEDPDRNELHPQELQIASKLRLKCNQYLANKRRIFLARHMALKEGKDFNKTSAQTATNIDVNKASRLFQAFDNVGWFDEQHFRQHHS